MEVAKRDFMDHFKRYITTLSIPRHSCSSGLEEKRGDTTRHGGEPRLQHLHGRSAIRIFELFSGRQKEDYCYSSWTLDAWYSRFPQNKIPTAMALT